jgi:hypothetical protein
MNTIDLTTPAAAAAYLRSLDPSTPVELAGAYENRPASAASDAVAVITGETSNAWAVSQNRWAWTAGELVAALFHDYHGESWDPKPADRVHHISDDGNITAGTVTAVDGTSLHIQFADGDEGWEHMANCFAADA